MDADCAAARRVLAVVERKIAGILRAIEDGAPNLADVYRERIRDLGDALMRDDAAEVCERIRGLVEAITLIPEDGSLRIEVRGELAAILSVADSARTAQSAGRGADALVEQVKMVAGTRNHRQYLASAQV